LDHHWILIILETRKQKVYYMDSLKGKSRMRIKLMSDNLHGSLFEFACKGLSPSKGEKKFQYVIDFGCLGHPPDERVAFLVCWHLDHLVQIQNTFRKTEDLEKCGSLMENTYFDYGQEFSRIQHMFAKIINTEVLAKTGLF
jgi:hypothetical protein